MLGSMNSAELPELQREVQRLIGRCLLRLQQFERLAKAVVVAHELGGPAHELEQSHAQRADEYATKTLGTLIGVLLKSYLTIDGATSITEDDSKMPIESVTLRYKCSIEMSADAYAKAASDLTHLVALRNDLVHHFLDRFDLQSVGGCSAACVHLDDCLSLIGRQYELLHAWAKSMDEAKLATAAFVQTPAFSEFVINGIAPDGTVTWEVAGIVKALRNAISELDSGEWTRLDHVIALVESKQPEQVPAKYGCRTWPQVLHESRVFDLQYFADESAPRVPWIRERQR